MGGTGLRLGTWAKIEDDCPIDFVTFGDVVEFSIGGRFSAFDLVVTEIGLETLLAKGTEALLAMRAQADAE